MAGLKQYREMGGGSAVYVRILRGLTLMVPHVGQTETVLLRDT